MKDRFSLNALAAFLLFFSVATPSVLAQSSFERDLDRLTQQRDEALHKAEAEIYRKYKIALDDLLRKATRNGDIAAAVKLKAALEHLPASILLDRKAPTETSELGEFLHGTVWSIRYDSPSGDEVYTLTFNKDGTLKHSEGRVSTLGFLGLRTIKLWGFDTATLNDDFNGFKATDANGKAYYGVLVPKD